MEVDTGRLPAGDKVLWLWMSANRDEKEFPDADEFIATRHPNRHLTFGTGIHRCLGQHLARIELRVAVDEVVRCLPDLRIADKSALEFRVGMTRYVATLPCLWG